MWRDNSFILSDYLNWQQKHNSLCAFSIRFFFLSCHVIELTLGKFFIRFVWLELHSMHRWHKMKLLSMGQHNKHVDQHLRHSNVPMIDVVNLKSNLRVISTTKWKKKKRWINVTNQEFAIFFFEIVQASMKHLNIDCVLGSCKAMTSRGFDYSALPQTNNRTYSEVLQMCVTRAPTDRNEQR